MTDNPSLGSPSLGSPSLGSPSSSLGSPSLGSPSSSKSLGSPSSSKSLGSPSSSKSLGSPSSPDSLGSPSLGSPSSQDSLGSSDSLGSPSSPKSLGSPSSPSSSLASPSSPKSLGSPSSPKSLGSPSSPSSSLASPSSPKSLGSPSSPGSSLAGPGAASSSSSSRLNIDKYDCNIDLQESIRQNDGGPDYNLLSHKLKQRAELLNIDVLDLINELLLHSTCRDYIYKMLLYQYNLQKSSIHDIWLKLMGAGYVAIDQMLTAEQVKPSRADYKMIMINGARNGYENIVEYGMQHGNKVDRKVLINAAKNGKLNIVRLVDRNDVDAATWGLAAEKAIANGYLDIWTYMQAAHIAIDKSHVIQLQSFYMKWLKF